MGVGLGELGSLCGGSYGSIWDPSVAVRMGAYGIPLCGFVREHMGSLCGGSY